VSTATLVAAVATSAYTEAATTAVPKMAATCSKTRGAARGGGGFSTATGGIAAKAVVAMAPMRYAGGTAANVVADAGGGLTEGTGLGVVPLLSFFEADSPDKPPHKPGGYLTKVAFF
jgi:hypothetical protein